MKDRSKKVRTSLFLDSTTRKSLVTKRFLQCGGPEEAVPQLEESRMAKRRDIEEWEEMR